MCISRPISVDGCAVTVDDAREVAKWRKLLAGRACATLAREGRTVDTLLLTKERRVERKPRALAVGIPTEVDR